MTSVVLRADGLTKEFPGVKALQNVSFDLRAGEVHALCGENGAGKSTLIKILSGVWPVGTYTGRLEVNGAEARFRGIADAETAGVGVIHQELALVREATVAENIFLGNEPTRFGLIDWSRVYARTRELLTEHGLALDPSARVGNLGVGQQQLVEIVKALAKKSRVLLLDEPTAALTESEVEILLRIVEGLKSRGITCVYISHKLDEVFRIADRITVLRDGQSVATLDRAATNRDEVVRHMVGRTIGEFFPRRDTPKGDVLLSVEGLTVTTRGARRPVLDGIGFEVRAGEVLGIGGLMGAGRTELLMHLFAGAGDRAAGRVAVKGAPFDCRTPDEAIRRGIMLVSEDRKRYGLVLDETIRFNLSLASLKSFVRSFLIDGGAEMRRNRTYFDSLKIRATGQDAVVRRLSGGNQQKVVLGKALMTEPSVIFLDEPTRGIDVGAKVEVYELINALTSEGKAVVMVSSELPELMGMSDRILVLSQGRVGGEFPRVNATQEAILEAAMAHHRAA